MGVVCWWHGPPLLGHDDVICHGHGTESPRHGSGCLHETVHYQTYLLQILSLLRETEWEAARVATSFP